MITILFLNSFPTRRFCFLIQLRSSLPTRRFCSTVPSERRSVAASPSAIAGAATDQVILSSYSTESIHAMEEDKDESSKEKLMQDDPPATAASLFTDDLILEILSRLPARSVCRFKCVSMPWRDLIADPVHRKMLPQTLAGFLYTTDKPSGGACSQFASVSGSAAPLDPSLSLLQQKYKYTDYSETCNGLLLCACSNMDTPASYECCYVVCNPATERWIELPPQPQEACANKYQCATCLAFDPKVSSHFHILQFRETILDVGSCVTEVDIFSSQTGAWIRRDSRLVEEITVYGDSRCVYFGGMLHLVGRLNPIFSPALLVVDMEGKAWKTILLPEPDGSSYDAFTRSSYHDTIGLSQGCLYYASTIQARINNSNKKNAALATKITLWCLENYDSKEWVLKRSASIDEPLSIYWRVFAIHPDCDTVFLVTVGGNMLAAYDMQHDKFVRILNFQEGNYRRYLPYVPLFSEVLAVADGQ